MSLNNTNQTKPPRSYSTAWEYEGKMWMFGGRGPSPEGYINDHGEHDGMCNNQLLRYDPASKEWSNPEYFGDVPLPRCHHTTTNIGHKVYLYSGTNNLDPSTALGDLHELDLRFLTWTNIQTDQPRPKARYHYSLNGLTSNQLILHGGLEAGKAFSEYYATLSDTWILDLQSQTWSQHSVEKLLPRSHHTSSPGVSNDIFIIGGRKERRPNRRLDVHNNVFRVVVQPKSLQKLAMQIVCKHQNALPWKEMLPKKLVQLIDEQEEDNTSDISIPSTQTNTRQQRKSKRPVLKTR